MFDNIFVRIYHLFNCRHYSVFLIIRKFGVDVLDGVLQSVKY